VSMAALSATRLLSLDSIVADKNGLQLPLMALGSVFRRYRSWNSIRKIDASPSTDGTWKSQSLIFYGENGKPFKLELGRLREGETEQLLLAIEMWATNSEHSEALKGIRAQLQEDAPKRHDMSFTDMWESELSRRFCATSFMPLEPGFILRKGSLKVVRQLAMGGLSAVYLCQLDNNELVVMKEAVVPDDSPQTIRDKACELFERESRLLMKLKHANIVKVLDHFVDQQRNYMMLEYINGQDLRQFIKQNGPQHERVVIEWAIQIANVLKYLHEQDPPIIHRDLTPDNLVLRADGTLVLIDFGAANEFISNATGTFVGKQAYIAPEQFRGKPVIQSDIYALGCTLHYMLTGQDPEALSESSPRELQPSVSVDLDELVVSCTQPEARDRFQSAAQLLPVLKKMAAGLVVS
jgi:predicted Ser/Thr protein kinase